MKAAGVATTVAGNDDWITDKESADPKVLPHLPGYHILIRPVAIREKTKGGILLPDKFKDDAKYLTTLGRVLKVGELAYADHNKFKGRAWCKPGDYVVYGKYQGDKFFIKVLECCCCLMTRYLWLFPTQLILIPTIWI